MPRNTLRKPLFATSLLAIGALALTSCAADTPSPAAEGKDEITLTLNWVLQAQFAGYIAADALGYYDDEDISLTINPGGPDINNVQLLLTGDTDIASSDFTSVLSANDSGAEIVEIAQVQERNSQGFIYFDDQGDLSDPKNWAGLTIGLWGGNSAVFDALAAGFGYDTTTDLTIANQSFDVNAFLTGELDLASAMNYNEYAQALSGAEGRAVSFVGFDELGFGVLPDALAVTREWLDANPELAERFLRASAKGWIHCRDNPEDCAELVSKAGSALPANYQLWQMEKVNEAIWPSESGLFRTSDELMQKSAKILHENGVISEEPDLATAIDFSLLDAALADFTEEDLSGASFQPLGLDPVELFGSGSTN